VGVANNAIFDFEVGAGGQKLNAERPRRQPDLEMYGLPAYSLVIPFTATMTLQV
jgi:hypothetical protein